MTCAAAKLRLDASISGELTRSEAAELAGHLSTCTACRLELEGLRTLQAATARLPREIEPRADLWPSLSQRLQPTSTSAAWWRGWWQIAMAAAAVVLLSVLLWQLKPAPAWTVAAVSGNPVVAARSFAGETKLRPGQWLETDAAASARLDVGEIGRVQVAPNSRVRLVATARNDHRIELSKGRLDALIWAPPRLFFVDTPAATVIDLGCAYTLTVDNDGAGTLAVTAGFVALEHQGRESIVPSGFACLTRRDSPLGTPFDPNAPEPLRRALQAFDFGYGSSTVIATILESARPQDAVTLWHLLSRTNGRDQIAVFDTLARLAPPPNGVTRDGVVSGSDSMRKAWGAAIGLSGWR